MALDIFLRARFFPVNGRFQGGCRQWRCGLLRSVLALFQLACGILRGRTGRGFLLRD